MQRDSRRFAYLIDRLLASDPSLDRLRSSARALLTAGLSAALFLLLTRWLGLQYKLALAGIVVPMMAVVAVQGPGRKQQQVTMAWVPAVASVVLVIGSFLAKNPWLSGGFFLLTILTAFEARRLGPRGSALGMIGYLSCFYSLLLKTPPAEVAWDPLFVFIGCAIAYASNFWLVPERPARLLRNELRAYRARLCALLHDLAHWLDGGADAAQARIDAHLTALSDQSLALESRLAGFAASAGLRRHVLRCEIAAETIAAVVRAAGSGEDATRRALASRLRVLQHSAAEGHPFDAAGWESGLALPDALRWRLGRAASALARLPAWRGPLPAACDAPAPQSAQAPVRKPEAGSATDARNARKWFDDTTRQALQACVAALAAMLAGRLLSPEHWYWAVISAFMVFNRSVTIGQTLSGAWQRVLATIAGVCVGVLAAGLVHGSRGFELSLLFVFIAVGFYAFRGWPNVYAAVLTAMLAMLYELLGQYSPGLLLERLEETAIGAASAVLSARLVLPVHTGDESDSKSAALLRAASRLLDSAFAGAQQRAPDEAMRELDRALQGLRASLGPVMGAAYPVAKKDRRRHLRRLVRVAYCVRHCCNLVAHHAPALAHAHTLRTAAGVLAANLQALATMLEAPVGQQGQGAEGAQLPPLERAAPEPGDGDEDGHDDGHLHIAAHWLQEANDVLRAVQAERARLT